MRMIKTHPNIVDITAAEFIKPRNPKVKALIITLKVGEVPNYISILEEPIETKVIPFETRPKRCMNGQKYGHVKSRCSGVARCAKCSQEGHTKQNCLAQEYCFHCREQHKVRAEACAIEKYEREIIRTQEIIK